MGGDLMSTDIDETLSILHRWYTSSGEHESHAHLYDLQDALADGQETPKPPAIFFRQHLPLWRFENRVAHASCPPLKNRELSPPDKVASIGGVYYLSHQIGLPITIYAERYQLSATDQDSRVIMLFESDQSWRSPRRTHLEEAFLNGYRKGRGVEGQQCLVVYAPLDQSLLSGHTIDDLSSFGLSLWCLGYALALGLDPRDTTRWICTGAWSAREPLNIQPVYEINHKVAAVDTLRQSQTQSNFCLLLPQIALTEHENVSNRLDPKVSHCGGFGGAPLPPRLLGYFW